MHFPPSGLVYPGLQRHQAAWLSTSHSAFAPQDILPQGDIQVRFKQASVFGHSLSLLHKNFCEGVSSTVPLIFFTIRFLKQRLQGRGILNS